MKTYAALLFIIIAAAYIGPRLDDYSAENAAADDAIRSERAAIKLMNAAKEMCGGENTVAQLHANGQWECFTKRGQRFAKVSK